MTVQEVKSKLNGVRAKYREYILAREKADRFRDIISAASAGASDAPQSAHSGNSTENKYITALWYSDQADRAFQEYMLTRQDAEAMIAGVKFPDEREVLTRRYILNQKWEDIADRMYFSLRQVHKLHSKGLISISETVH